MMHAAGRAASGALQMVKGVAQFALKAAQTVLRSTIITAAAVGAGVWYAMRGRDGDEPDPEQEMAYEEPNMADAWEHAPMEEMDNTPALAQEMDHLAEVNQDEQTFAEFMADSALDALQGDLTLEEALEQRYVGQDIADAVDVDFYDL